MRILNIGKKAKRLYDSVSAKKLASVNKIPAMAWL